MIKPLLSAGTVLVHPDGSILMQHRDNKPSIAYPDHWCLPGGRMKKGEDAGLSAARELEEETGYVIPNPEPLIVEEYKLPDGISIRRHIFWGIL